MYKKLLLFTLIFFFFGKANSQEMTPEMEAFISRMDGANLEELERELDEGLEGLRAFAGFFDGPGSEGIKDYTKEEERFEEPFKIDTSIVSKAVRQFENIGFQQIFREDKSYLKFQKIGDDFWNTVWMEEGMEEKFIPKTIFYKDGTRSSEGISDNQLSFFFENPWGAIAVIDSIEIDYNIRYTSSYDSLILTKNSKKVKYKDGVIKVEKLDKNHLYLTVSDKYASGLYVRALNYDGKPLNQNSSSFSPMRDNKSKDGFTELVSLLEEIQTKLKANKFKDSESLKKYLLKKVSSMESVKDKDGVYHKKYYFEGNIESLQLFIETEEKSKTVSFSAINNSDFRDILLKQTNGHLIFMDTSAKELFRISERPLERIGERLFIENEAYYYLNLHTKSLDSLEAIKVFETINGLAFIQRKMENGFLAYDSNMKQLSEIEFPNVWSVDKEYAHTLDKNEINYAIDADGNIKKIEGVDGIGELSDGLLMARSNDKYGYIDPSGEIIIPLIYTNAEIFNDGLAIVANENNKYGLIDTSGSTVIPFDYFDIMSYENGIAWVSTEDGYQLIDKTGKVLAIADGSSYSVSGSGVQKTYQFGDKKYDAFGKLISEDAK